MDQQLEIGDQNRTNSAAQAAVSVLMSALAKNSTSSESALGGLMGALEKDHDGSILDDVLGLMTGKSQSSNPKTMNGLGILGHLLGGKQSGAVDLLTQMTGLDKNQSLGMLVKMAPMVLGVLGRYKKQNNLDARGIGDFLKTSQQRYVEQDRERSIFEKFLDQDGDGSIMDEAASIGMKLLGNFLKR